MGIAVDYTISLGTLIEVGSILAGGFIALGIMKRTVEEMKSEIEKIERKVESFAQSLVTIAVQSSRLDRIEKDIMLLRRGRGRIIEEDNDD